MQMHDRETLEIMGMASLVAYAEEIEKEKTRQDLLVISLDGAAGEAVLGELREMLDASRRAYARIPVNFEFSVNLLSAAQAEEHVVQLLLSKFGDAKKYQKTLDKQHQLVIQVIASQRNRNNARRNSVVAAGAKKEK